MAWKQSIECKDEKVLALCRKWFEIKSIVPSDWGVSEVVEASDSRCIGERELWWEQEENGIKDWWLGFKSIKDVAYEVVMA